MDAVNELKRAGLLFRSLFLVMIVMIGSSGIVRGGATGTAMEASREPSARILLIPIDDRPPCLQWPVLLGQIVDADVIAPPRELLGRFAEPGDPERIKEWIREQDLESFDALIASFDMLAYGGLIASRVHLVDRDKALDRLTLLEELRENHPDLPIVGFSVIMRLAPSADGRNEEWRVPLARWAEISVRGPEHPEVEGLEREIPEEVLAGYKRTRARNLAINHAAIDFAQKGTVDYLLLGQDDAKPEGVHVSDREQLLARIENEGLSSKVALQPGTDEVAMLLLSRVLTQQFEYTPRIAPVYSSEESRVMVAPYEDAPLHQTVSLQIAAAGAREVPEEDADLLYFVYASRHETGRAEAFADRIAEAVQSGRPAIVADIDTRGNIQGSDVAFTEALRERDIIPRLHGYASWNTAGNTLGTALPQGILFTLARSHFSAENVDRVITTEVSQLAFLVQRVINDYLYHGRVRPSLRGLPRDHDPEETAAVIKEKMAPLIEDLWEDFSGKTYAAPAGSAPGIVPRELTGFQLDLPWGRTFEAEIAFDITIQTVIPSDK